MTEIQIPYLPSAQFFKIRCRLGINEQDIIGDSDSNPQIRTTGGTVSIFAMVPRFRYIEADGRSRVVYTKTETYNIQTSTGELFDADGNIGVNLLNTNSPQMDPQGWTYKATVRPNGGEPFDVPIPSDGGGEVFDLGDGLVFSPSTGITDLETRVKALEDAQGGGPGLPENFNESVQDIVGSMVTSAGGTYNDAAGTITLPTPEGTRGLIITGTNVTNIPAGDATDNLAAYYNSGSAPITVQGTSIAAGAHAVWAWVSGAWVLLSAGTGGTPPPDGETITKAPAAPTFNTFAHTLTIPSDVGVTYQLSCTGAVSPVDALAGTWTIPTGAFASGDTGTKTITLTSYPGTVYVGTTAQAGYLLSEPSSWSAEFAETVSPYVAAAPADTQYLFVLDDAPGTTIPANSGTAGKTGVAKNGTLTYGAVTSGVGATALDGGGGSADIRLNGVLTSAVTAWTWCAVLTVPVGKGLNMAADGTTSPTFKAGFTISWWDMVADWSNKNTATIRWGTNQPPGLFGAGPTTPCISGTTRTWAKGDRLFVAATWDGATFKMWLGDATGLQLASSVADVGPVTTPATWKILCTNRLLTDTNSPVRSVGGLIAHLGRAFTQAELEALNNAVVRP